MIHKASRKIIIKQAHYSELKKILIPLFKEYPVGKKDKTNKGRQKS